MRLLIGRCVLRPAPNFHTADTSARPSQDTFSRVLVTLKVLRNRLYTTLPAEIFSYPGEEPSDDVRRELEQYGAKLRTIDEAERDTRRT